MKTYPEIYEYETLGGVIRKSVTMALLRATIKLSCPYYSQGQFSAAYDWRIRLEVLDCHKPNDPFYVLDVGQGYESWSLERFKVYCDLLNSAITVPYCDNNLVFSQNSIDQWSGTFKVYAMTNGNTHEYPGQNWITEMVSAYVEAINSLDDHCMVADPDAIGT